MTDGLLTAGWIGDNDRDRDGSQSRCVCACASMRAYARRLCERACPTHEAAPQAPPSLARMRRRHRRAETASCASPTAPGVASGATFGAHRRLRCTPTASGVVTALTGASQKLGLW
jgi:hypothetical protein